MTRSRHSWLVRLARSVLLATSTLFLLAMSGCPSKRSSEMRLGPRIEAASWSQTGGAEGDGTAEAQCEEVADSEIVMLSGLRGYMGAKKYSDRFVSRVRVDCTPYAQKSGELMQTGSTVSRDATVDHEEYRSSGGVAILVGATEVPIGVIAIHDRDDEYIKNLHLVSGWVEADGRVADYADWWRDDNRQVSPPTLSDYTSFDELDINQANAADGSRHRALLCPEQHVLTGLGTEQSSDRTYKIRSLRVFCRELIED